jgi:dipeptidyl aminopeptidase/acylaminoacyl peptidase
VTPEAVTFRADDGHEAHAQLFTPQDHNAKPRPAILFFHGGPRRQMLVGFHPMGAYNWMYCLNQYLVAKGYIVLSVNYRGGTGYGLDYREADDFGPGGGSELHDLLGAVAYLKARKDVDPAKLGIWGASYGGLMTALGLARAPDAFATGVDYAGVYNWATFLTSIGLPPDTSEATRRAVDSSLIATIDRWRPRRCCWCRQATIGRSLAAGIRLLGRCAPICPARSVDVPDEILIWRYASG